MRYVVALSVLIAGLAYATGPLPAVPTDPFAYSQKHVTTTEQSTSLSLDAGGVSLDGGCAAPGDPFCRVILDVQNVSGWPNISVYVANAGGDAAGLVTLADVMVEYAPTATGPWGELAAGQMDSITNASGLTVKLLNNIGHIAFLRVEARSPMAMNTKVWVSANR